MSKANKNKESKKPLSKKRLALRIVLCTLGAVILIVAGYLLYVVVSYKRVPDNQVLSVDVVDVADPYIETDTTYRIISYNIGFGAYTPDYSFFMDGGKSSWAKSESALNENLSAMTAWLCGQEPDFALFQEVDVDGTRTYHVNELSYLEDNLLFSNYAFAQNFDSAFLFYPLTEPHGANKSGILTGSNVAITSALRRSLPVSDSFSKLVDLDRCYSISRIPVSDGKELVLFNVHLSAYGSDESVREGQLGMLTADLQAEYDKGNYIICGGDFNHNLRIGGSEKAPDWALPFPREKLPSCMTIAFDLLNGQEGSGLFIDHNSCRNADEPYDPNTTFTVMADGFIVSDNVRVISYESVDLGYAYSDHDPVLMEFELIGD